MEGSLSKWTNVVNGWQYRWFVLDDNAGLLSYYTVKIFLISSVAFRRVRLAFLFFLPVMRSRSSLSSIYFICAIITLVISFEIDELWISGYIMFLFLE